VRVIDDDAIAPFAGRGSADACRDAMPARRIFKARLGVLIASKLKNISPVLPILRRLNQQPAMIRISQ
jgi:hypothetical protein